MTPQNQVGGPPQQSWFARNKVLVVAVGCLIPTLCCGASLVVAALMPQNAVGNGAARVDCGTPGPGGVDCEVKRTEGTGGLNVCWDLEITCANGGVMTGSACGSLAAGALDNTVNMAVADFSNQSGCDAPKSGAVKRLVVNPE